MERFILLQGDHAHVPYSVVGREARARAQAAMIEQDKAWATIQVWKDHHDRDRTWSPLLDSPGRPRVLWNPKLTYAQRSLVRRFYGLTWAHYRLNSLDGCFLSGTSTVASCYSETDPLNTGESPVIQFSWWLT